MFNFLWCIKVLKRSFDLNYRILLIVKDIVCDSNTPVVINNVINYYIFNTPKYVFQNIILNPSKQKPFKRNAFKNFDSVIANKIILKCKKSLLHTTEVINHNTFLAYQLTLAY